MARKVVRKQLEIIDPDVVICGSREVFDFAKEIFGTPEESLPIEGGKSVSCFRANDMLFLDFYHPACRKSREFLYDFSVGVFRNLKSSAFC